MQQRAKMRLATLGSAVVLTTTACTAANGSTTGAAGSAGTVAEGETVTIGFSQRRLAGSDWWATLLQGAKDKAAETGAEVIVTDAGGDTVKQNSDVQTLLTKGADVIILNPHDPTGVAPAVAATTTAGIPLVVVNGNLSEELAPKQFCYVAEDQPTVAAHIGAAIAELAKTKFAGEDSVTAVIIGGYSGESITDQRSQGVVDGYASVDGAPAIEYLPIRYGEWLPDRALPPMRDIATAHPDLDIVFSLSDVMLPGIQQGLKDAGLLDQVVIGTYDGQMSVLKQMIDDADGPIQADASNDPYQQGQVAVEKAIAAAQGQSQDDVCPGGTHWIDTFLATPSNASELYDPKRTF